MEQDAESIALGPYEIWYGRSTDGGETWQKTRLTYTSLPSTYPSIATDELGQVHIVWCEETSPGVGGQIWYIRSPNDGETWEEPILLSNPSVTIPSSHPAIAVDNSNRVKVVWYEGGNPPKIKLRRSTDGGVSWLGEQEIYSLSPQDAVLKFPAITNDEANRVHAVWTVYGMGMSRIVYRRSTDGGETWEEPQEIWSGRDGGGITTNNNSLVNVVWTFWPLTSSDQYEQVWHIFSTDGGVTWRDAQRLNCRNEPTQYPIIVANDQNVVYAVWQGLIGAGNWEIYFRRSLDGGLNWEPEIRLTSASSDSKHPFIIIDKLNSLHIIWTDRRDGNEEIYYKKGVQFLSSSSEATAFNQGRNITREMLGRRLLIVYEDNQKVYHSYSYDERGEVWSPPEYVSNGKHPVIVSQFGAIKQTVPWIAYLSNGSVMCAIRGPSGNWIYRQVFQGNPPNIYAGPPSLCWGGVYAPPRCYIVYPVYLGSPPTNSYIYFNEVFYDSVSAPDILEVTGDTICRSPAIAMTPEYHLNRVHVVWEKGGRIYYRERRNGGWLPIEPVSTPTNPVTEPASNPSIEPYGEYIYVVWRGPNNVGDPIGDIWQRRKRLDQLEWERPRNQSQTLIQESNFPVMSANFVTVWQENVSGNNIDIWVKWLPETDPRPLIQTPKPSLFPQIYGEEVWEDFYLHTIWTEEMRLLPFPLYEVRFNRCRYGPTEPIAFYSLEIGGEEPSLYCEERDGFIRYGEYSIDYGNENLRYRLRYLDPRYYYLVRAVVYRRGQNNWIEEFYSDTTLIATLTLEPNRPETLWFILPKESYQDSCEAVLEIEKVVGDFVSLADLAIFRLERIPREFGGGQSFGNSLLPRVSLHPSCPNPFRNKTIICYQLPARGKVSLRIYDISGKLIKTLEGGEKEASMHSTSWDGKDDRGRILPAGVYFYQLKSEGFTDTKRLVLIR